jgi:hypothetical protein
VKLRINGTFELPKGTGFLEGLIRFSIFLKQWATGADTDKTRWQGDITVVQD